LSGGRMHRIVILGAGGNSLGIIDAIEALNAIEPRYRIEGLLDDLAGNRGRDVRGYNVLGSIDDAAKFPGCRFVNGISSVASFRKILDIIRRTGVARDRFETVIHPRATLASSARVGAGCTILAGSVVGPEAAVGDHAIILQNTTLDHHVRVGDYATLSAGITILGYAEIGRNAFVGGGSSIAPRVKIGDSALIGLGSVVIRDVPAGKVFAGNPAREIDGSPHALPAD
jgi:sugar O-acyltransferase (sialic acid O-acetyltransferase NeuD family)